MEKVLEILKLAVEKESMRKAAYLEAAANTTNPLAKATFEELAKDEDKHAVYLKAYYDKQVANEGWPAHGEIVEDEDSMAVVQQIFKYANQMIDQAGACSEDLTEVYEAALAAENESIHLYTDAIAHTDDPNAKAFFGMLVEAEKTHAKVLTETQDYLDDTSKWFFDEEMWIVEG
ncbi:MAG: ferritin family protein [Armatimonadia bacterium]